MYEIHPRDRGTPGPAEAADPDCLDAEAAAALLAGTGSWRRCAIVGDALATRELRGTPGYANHSWPDRLHTAMRDASHNTLVRGYADPDASSPARVVLTQVEEVLAWGPDLVLVATAAHLADLRLTPTTVGEELKTLLFWLVSGSTTQRTLVVLPPDPSGIPGLSPRERLRLRHRYTALAPQIRAAAVYASAACADLSAHPADPDLYDADALRLSGRGEVRLTARGHALTAAAVIRTLAAIPGGAAGTAPQER